MGPESDGSSSAALGAQDDNTDAATRRPGLFERLTGALAPSRQSTLPVAEVEVPRAASPGLGLGNLHAKRVEDVAVPRADMVSVPADIELPELIAVFRDSGLTRLPVFKDTLDTPIGMIHLKDLALKHGFATEGSTGVPFSLEKIVREVLFVPPSMPIGVLLQKMQSGRKHMALVIDEYGGVDGLVTIEDLIEQVIRDGRFADIALGRCLAVLCAGRTGCVGAGPLGVVVAEPSGLHFGFPAAQIGGQHQTGGLGRLDPRGWVFCGRVVLDRRAVSRRYRAPRLDGPFRDNLRDAADRGLANDDAPGFGGRRCRAFAGALLGQRSGGAERQ